MTEIVLPLITCLDASFEAVDISIPASDSSDDITFDDGWVPPPSDMGALPFGWSDFWAPVEWDFFY